MDQIVKEKKLKLVHFGDCNKLVKMFGVSRNTVGNALALRWRSELSKKIRAAAVELGAVEYED